MSSFLPERKREILSPEEILARAMDALAYEVTRLQRTASMGAPLESKDAMRLISYTKLLNETIKVKQEGNRNVKELERLPSAAEVNALLLRAADDTDTE